MLPRITYRLLALCGIIFGLTGLLVAGSATNITGLYFTDINDNGTTLADGSADPH